MSVGRAGFTRIAFCGLVLATTAGAVWAFHAILAVWGMTAPEWALLGLYALLTTWIGASFWISVVGAVRLRRSASEPTQGRSSALWRRMAGQAPPVAVVMPLHNEDAERSLNGLRATYESLADLGVVTAFHFFVLSDSSDSQTCRGEEAAWVHLCRDLEAGGQLFYRRRRDRTGKKAGNIQEFCTRWGRRYDYMIVLDADSVMAGSTIVEMVRRMDAEPELGLLQAWPAPVNAATLFARAQQFAAQAYGRVIAAGLASLMEPWATYWGHNAIIRVDAFMQSCGLPRLPGREPLGGEILSHDFVEAALLARRGWRIRIMAGAEGSYEEGPTNLLDHAQRDRRWCQGNLQHVRLVATEGFRWPSRLNFVIGIFSYCASPLWLAFMATAVYVAADPAPFSPDAVGAWLTSFHDASGASGIPWLIGLAALLLLGPKLLALALTLLEPARRRAFGGAGRLSVNVLLEILYSALIAPVMMLLHAEFVLSVLAGRTVKWAPQHRDDRQLYLTDATRILGPRAAVGGGLAVLACWFAPTLVLWMLPLVVGFASAVPLAVWSSRDDVGRWSRRAGLFLTPSESSPHAVLKRLAALRGESTGKNDGSGPLVREAGTLLTS